MKITIESTSKIIEINGVPARVWEGQTESGIAVHCFITRIAVDKENDTAQFDKELQQTKAPTADIQSYPLRIIL
jgi:hypothetical protein